MTMTYVLRFVNEIVSVENGTQIHKLIPPPAKHYHKLERLPLLGIMS